MSKFEIEYYLITEANKTETRMEQWDTEQNRKDITTHDSNDNSSLQQ